MTPRLELRLWMRLLGTTTPVLARLRRNLKDEFDITMPAFDLMAQTHRAPQGPTMGDLSERLMVSKGNVTDLVLRLEGKGLVERRADTADGRVQHVWLTPAGEALTERMLARHQTWLAEAMAGLDPAAMERLYREMGALKVAVENANADPKRSHKERMDP